MCQSKKRLKILIELKDICLVTTERFTDLQAKFAYGGTVIGSSQFAVLPQLPQKMTLTSKWSKSTQINHLTSLI